MTRATLELANRCVVPQSNAIIGAVTTGYECLPPSCDGLTGPDDHGPMISRLIDRGIEELQVTKLDRVDVQLVDPRVPESQYVYDMY
ncbi:hypothetical protein F511_16434 [Dorcoceras hygrometricum]|uniref:Uncharacterized protein n=1 Tax=Dorcoceras hygrometricum TaxID=472368 RepID=A0A2Z7AFE1_9LAMI|nr:hypothetical protein F511_16434 [Dorcoceras hygrometricum]